MSEQRRIASIDEPAETTKTFLRKLLDVVEKVGNKLPHPAVIFFILTALVILLSHVFYLLGTSVNYEVVNPQTHQIEHATATVNSLLSGDGIRFMKIVQVTPRKAATWIFVTLGVLSSIASDAGYLVLIPLGAGAFLSLGRHPLAGLAAAFAGVAAVFGVNFLILPIDPILTEITNNAIHLLNPTYSINLTANFYFAVVSSPVLIVVCTLVSERVVEPRLDAYRGEVPADSGGGVTAEEARELRLALYQASWSSLF